VFRFVENIFRAFYGLNGAAEAIFVLQPVILEDAGISSLMSVSDNF
jgi:hypothetical protein